MRSRRHFAACIGVVLAAAFVLQSRDATGEPPVESGGSTPEGSPPDRHEDPFPRIEVAGGVAPSELRTAAGRLAREYKCPACDGRGAIVKKVRTGTRRGGHFRYPIREEVEETCGRCSGTHYASAEVIERCLEAIVVAWAGLDADHPEAAAAMDFAARALLSAESLAPDDFASIVNHRVARGGFKPGAPLFLVGSPFARPRLPTNSERTCVLCLPGWVEPSFVVVSTSYFRLSPPGEPLFAGGIYAGETDLQPSHGNVPVLRHGFVIGFP